MGTTSPGEREMTDHPSSLQPLRVGVVGLGYAGRTHLESYLQLPDTHVIALADPDPERLSRLGEIHNIPHLHHDHQELLAREDLDAISVCTPNHLHAPVAIAALERGRHVLCEKPLARSGPEAEAIVQAAIQAGRVLKVAFNHRARADVVALKHYIETGGLGHIYYAKAYWLRRSGIPGLGSWFTNKEMAGGGPLIDLGVHVLDMALYLLDEPQALMVSAAIYAELGPRGRGGSRADKMMVGSDYQVEDLATAFIRLAGGTTLTLETSWATYRRANDEFGVTLYGNEGGAEIRVVNYVQEDTLRIYTDVAGLPTELAPQLPRGDGYGHRQVVHEFVATVRSGDWSAHVGRDGLARARLIDACYASALQGREVLLGDLMSASQP
jgi:predicted dehydrogenase